MKIEFTKTKTLALIMAFVLLVLAACSNSTSPSSSTTSSPQSETTPPESSINVSSRTPSSAASSGDSSSESSLSSSSQSQVLQQQSSVSSDPTPVPDSTSTTHPTPAPVSAEAGGIIQLGGYDWRVLDVRDGKVFILSDKILENRPYHNITLLASDSITWAECSLRKYLNGEFYDKTFTSAEKARIIETNVANKNNQWFDTPGGKNTKDKIFLLSLEEVVQYFGDSGQLNVPNVSDNPVIYDEYQENRIAYHIDSSLDHVQWGRWWLRSPGSNQQSAAYVNNGGVIDIGSYYNFPSSTDGVRPAMWITVE